MLTKAYSSITKQINSDLFIEFYSSYDSSSTWNGPQMFKIRIHRNDLCMESNLTYEQICDLSEVIRTITDVSNAIPQNPDNA